MSPPDKIPQYVGMMIPNRGSSKLTKLLQRNSKKIGIAFLSFAAIGAAYFPLPTDAVSISIRGPIQSFDQLDRKACYSFELLDRESGGSLLKGRATHAPLGWTTSGLWSDAELLLMDNVYSSVVRVPIGGFIDSVELDQSSFDMDRPWFIATMGNQSYVTLAPGSGDGRIAVVHDGVVENFFRDLVPSVRGRTLFDSEGDPFLLKGVFQVASMNGGRGVLAYADLANKEHMDFSKFIYLDRSADTYQPFDIREDDAFLFDLTLPFYSKDLAYVASARKAGFALILTKDPWVARLDLGNPIAKDLGRPSALEGFNTPKLKQDPSPRPDFIDKSAKVYREIELSRMVMGIYAWSDRLFVLGKSECDPDTGATSWTLVEISPEDGSQIGSPIELPTRAASITLVPGDDYWAIVEKGMIDVDERDYFRRVLYRPALSTVLIPSSWISNKRSWEKSLGCSVIRVG